MDIDETRYYREKDGNILKLEIYRDGDPMNPRTEWDNISTMVCFHRRYNLGDVRTLKGGKTVVIPHTNVRYDNSTDGAEAFVEWAKKELKDGNLVIASLELYDHSGITMRVHGWGDEAFGYGRTGWDSCIVGWCFVTKDRAYAELVIKDDDDWGEKAKSYIKSEVETYDSYLTNEVYGFRLSRLESYVTVENGVEKVNFGRSPAWIEVDSCNGYYGSNHEKNGILDCVPKGSTRIREDELPEQVKGGGMCEREEIDNNGIPRDAPGLLADIKWNCEHCTARQDYEARKRKVGGRVGGDPCRSCRMQKYGYGGGD